MPPRKENKNNQISFEEFCHQDNIILETNTFAVAQRKTINPLTEKIITTILGTLKEEILHYDILDTSKEIVKLIPFKDIDNESSHKTRVFEAATNFKEMEISWYDNDKDKSTNTVNSAPLLKLVSMFRSEEDGQDYLKLTINDKITDMLLNFRNHGGLNAYDRTIQNSMKSQYSQRLYPYLKSYFNHQKRRGENSGLISITDFRKEIGISDGYRTYNIKVRILDVAMKEFLLKSDFWFTYEFVDIQYRPLKTNINTKAEYIIFHFFVDTDITDDYESGVLIRFMESLPFNEEQKDNIKRIARYSAFRCMLIKDATNLQKKNISPAYKVNAFLKSANSLMLDSL